MKRKKKKERKKTVRVVTHRGRFGSCRHSSHIQIPCNNMMRGFCSIDGKKCEVKGLHLHGPKIRTLGGRVHVKKVQP